MNKQYLLLSYQNFKVNERLQNLTELQVYQVTSLQIAKELCDEVKFDGIFTEVMVNKDKIAGYQLMKHARNNFKNFDTPIYAIGLDRVESCREWAKRLGFDDYLFSNSVCKILKHLEVKSLVEIKPEYWNLGA